jgi:hypothetical protein
LTAVVEFDVAVDVEPIVDLHVDHWLAILRRGSGDHQRSTYKVEEGVDV